MQVVQRKCYDLTAAVRLHFVLSFALPARRARSEPAARGEHADTVDGVRTGNAVYDGAVSAWAAKRIYNTARAASFIPSHFFDESFDTQHAGPYCPPRAIRGFEWRPYQPPAFVSPPFPAFVSGAYCGGRGARVRCAC